MLSEEVAHEPGSPARARLLAANSAIHPEEVSSYQNLLSRLRAPGKDERLLGNQDRADLETRPASVRLAQKGESSHTPHVPKSTRWDRDLGGPPGQRLESHSWLWFIRVKRTQKEIGLGKGMWVTLGKARHISPSALPVESRPMHLVPKAAGCHSTREQ